MKARISHLYKTEAEWSKLPNFVPIQGEFVIFSPDNQYRYARLKIGDGSTLLKQLPFVATPTAVDNFSDNSDIKVIDAGRITDSKNI